MSLEVFCVVVSLIIYFSMLLGSGGNSRTNRFFMWFILFNIGMVAFDALALMFRGNMARHAFYLVRAANFLHYIFGSLTLASFTYYMLTRIELKVEVPRAVKTAALSLCAVSLSLTVVSQFNGMYYIIDEFNIYQRQGFFWLSQTLPMFGLAMNIVILLAYRKSFEGKAALFFLTYMIIPVAALAAQLSFYGITFINISTTLIILILYVGVQTEQVRSKDAENAALDSLSRMKTEYLANVSHEMKTPLTVVSVHVQQAAELYAVDCGQNAAIADSLTRAQGEIMRASRMVENALRLASMQEEHARLKPFSAAALLRSGAEAYRTVLERRGNALKIVLPNELPRVCGNAEQIIQVVANLLTNANAHTRDGRVTVEARADGGFVAVTVSDTGSGIEPKLLPRVFERGVSSSGGSGVGLSICKSIVEAHGGEIEVGGVFGKGTEVRFTIPIFTGEGADGGDA